MIAITNCSLLNPSPEQLLGSKNDKSFSVYYQNVQGLILFTELNKKHPNLDYWKIAEIHAYIHKKHPDVIILNETWLKSSILDEEIFPINDYKVFRCDRSDITHPKDPYNPSKFRKNGGGVLIAISSSLQVSSNITNLKCGADLMAVELVLEDGSKFDILTCYRIGTLGTENCNEIFCALNKMLRKKKLKKFLLVGDFNLRNANWEINSSANNIEQMFLEEFQRLSLVQCITSPTHNKGKILDILLTNSENHLSNISIISDQQFCKSNHFGISFDVKFKIKRKRPIKIKSFNFKRANWDILNEELKSINWVSVLDSPEPDIAWLRFKDTLNYYLDLYIPKITIEINSKPPWFDVYCYKKCREKERLFKKYKRTKTMHDELKIVKCRREFKSMMRSKMRDNLFENSDSNAITKQFCKIFDLNDLIFFHKIVNCQIPTKLPNYVLIHSGASRLRNNRLDYDCYVCNLEHSTYAKSKSPLFTNYFYRVVHIWNKLPLSTRRTTNLDNFKNLPKKFLWEETLKM